MPALTLILAPSPSLGATLDSIAQAHLPEGTQVLAIAPEAGLPDWAQPVRDWQEALEGASGDYLQFLLPGDTLLPWAQAAAVDKAERCGAQCIRGCALPLRDDDTVADLPGWTLSELDPGLLHLPLKLGEGSPLLSLAEVTGAWLFRRDFLTALGLHPGEAGFLWRALCAGERIVLCRDMLCAAPAPQSAPLQERLEGLTALEDALVRNGADLARSRAVMLALLEQLMQEHAREDRVKAWVQGYHGLCSDEIEPLWRSARTAGPRTAPQVRTFPLRREGCGAPKVSVVLPIYNVQEYLNQALYSLQVQTLEEMEFLCVNDGSTDGSMTILREYAAVDGRFRILDGPNGGYGRAVNRGMDAAAGAYIGILEPDDYVGENMYRRLYRAAVKDELDFVKSNYFRFRVDAAGRTDKKRMYVSREEGWYDRVIDPAAEQGAFHLPMKTWNGIYSRDFLRRNDIRHHESPGASYQDNGFWFQTMCKARRILFLHNTFYHYRQDNPNSSINNTGKLYCMTEEYDWIWQWLESQGLAERFDGIYQAKRYHNFSTTYRRIAEAYRREYLHHIRDVYLPVREAGRLREECFEPLFYKQLNEILEDPDAFYEKIRVSVILPVYNCEAYLPQCLDSILQRNDQRIEVICVDDGSTDGSARILADYAARDSRVRVLRQANAGAGAARNTGMAQARGEYLSFLDADDFFDPEMLRKAYNKAWVEESDIVVFRSQEYYEDLDRFVGMRSNFREEYLPQQQPFAGTDVEENLFRAFVGWAWDKLFRRAFVEENGLRFQEQRTTNDLLFTYSALVRAQRISTMNNVLAYHRKASGSLSVTREQSWDCFYAALLALRQQLRDWGLYERFERDFVNYALHFCLWNLDTLRGSAYRRLYERLRESWLEELGILGRERRYFYAPEQYARLQHLLETGAEDFLFDRMDETVWTLEETRRERNRLLRRTEELEQRVSAQQTRNAQTRRELQQERQQRRGAEKALKQAQRSPIARLGGKVKRLFEGK